MQQSNPKATKLSPVYGIVIALVSIVLTIIFYATDLYGALWTGFCTSLVFFLGVLVSIIHYNSRHHEHTSVKAAFAMGFRTTLLATILIAVFTIIFHFLIMSSDGHHQMVEQSTGVVIQDENVKRNFWIMFLGNILFVNMVMGLLAAAVGALVFKANQKTSRNN
ncbi:DUF4199 domain-containing protein [Chitinophaga solisilvae]|uniref:DUF4199 domain-containing protein n=1 Tax=Chitinophaga solisilvae TaxID=1233460 RepID=UPI001369F02C|nr:DUF4199 domain-containing protein [Chitinophaga solisilvae]